MSINRCKMANCTGLAFGKATPRCHRAECPGGTITNEPSPLTHDDGRRTASNFVDCLLADVATVVGELSSEARRDLKDRFHVSVKMNRRIGERFRKKHRREIVQKQTRI